MAKSKRPSWMPEPGSPAANALEESTNAAKLSEAQRREANKRESNKVVTNSWAKLQSGSIAASVARVAVVDAFGPIKKPKSQIKTLNNAQASIDRAESYMKAEALKKENSELKSTVTETLNLLEETTVALIEKAPRASTAFNKLKGVPVAGGHVTAPPMPKNYVPGIGKQSLISRIANFLRA